jgi:hypothetical protein
LPSLKAKTRKFIGSKEKKFGRIASSKADLQHNNQERHAFSEPAGQNQGCRDNQGENTPHFIRKIPIKIENSCIKKSWNGICKRALSESYFEFRVDDDVAGLWVGVWFFGEDLFGDLE